MRGYEDTDLDIEDGEYVEEPTGRFSRRIVGILLISLGVIGTTVAANISINSGRIEMGQGIYRIQACDQWVGINLIAAEAASAGLSKVKTVELVGLDPRLCKNVLFQIKMFKNSDPEVPLELFNGTTGTDTVTATTTTGPVTRLTIYDTATVSFPSPTTSYDIYARRALTLVNQAGVNVGYNDGFHRITYFASTGIYQVIFTTPIVLMADVDRITIESSSLTS